ncbi:MAG: M1 family metallopeptidase [Chitinophagaceae bacterium]|nr:M1 family metallopeptidase [Chitinophagaceae bacterium]
MNKLFLRLIIISALFPSLYSCAQPLNNKDNFTRLDTLRGSIGAGRDWWDVIHYNLSLSIDYVKKEITGTNQISFNILKAGKGKVLQLDLQEPMVIDKILYGPGLRFEAQFKREGNVYWVTFGEKEFTINETNKKDYESIYVHFHGKPHEATRPPWDGGWIWTKDAKGRPWMTVACQGLGASVWYPCKDHQSDEPDEGAIISIEVPDTLTAVANGVLLPPPTERPGQRKVFSWMVQNPINNYNIVPYIGKYVNWQQVYKGEEGTLSLDYWVLDYNLEKSKKQFGRDVKRMLEAFEYWFGPYPFYEDGFKIVESSHLGMEHQSAIAYGNYYLDGYLGMDLSGSGWGKKWDYIIVHESGHEWFANNITTNDIADMWVHEGFTMYSEVLFTEYHYGKQAADEYLQGIRQKINNDIPLIGPYGVNQEGSGDMYNKGAALLHTIRQVINDDTVFRRIMRGLNKDFYHKTVDSKDVEEYFSRISGKDLSKIFDQYLRTIKIPVLEYKTDGRKLIYRWANCIDGFSMPVTIGTGKAFSVFPRTEWQETELPLNYEINDYNKNLYISLKKVQ